VTPLFIIGDWPFLGRVRTGLKEVCPCRGLQSQYLGQVPGAGKWIVAFEPGGVECACYCALPGGCNLLADIIDLSPAQATTIAESHGDHLYSFSYNRVYYNPDRGETYSVDTVGNTTTLPSVLLAHELIHAVRDWGGTSKQDDDLTLEEHETVRGENQIRREHSLPLRLEYDGQYVANYNVGIPDVDETDRHDCECEPKLGGCGKYLIWLPWELRKRIYFFTTLLRRFRTNRRVRSMTRRSAFVNGFNSLLASADPRIVARTRSAFRTRACSAVSAEVDRYQAAFDGASEAVWVEGIGVVGAYRVTVIMVAAGEIKVLTNLRPPSESSPQYIGEPSDLVEYTVPLARIQAMAGAISGPAFVNGSGGEVVADGTVQLLTVKSGGDLTRAIQDGYSYGRISAIPQPPPPDNDLETARWNAVSHAYELWHEFMSDASVVRTGKPVRRSWENVLKWIGIALGGLAGLLVLASLVLFIIGSTRLNKTHEIQLENIAIPTSDTAIARGQHLVEALTFCQACHGENLEGDVFIDEPMMAAVYAPNLTSGQGGVGGTYTDADYVGAIRHGVNPEGRGLLIMHSDVFHNLSEEDLGAVIAYVKSVPPVDKEIPDRRLLPLGRILVALGRFDSEAVPFIAAEVIDHSAPFVEMPEMRATAEYGQYLMSITLCSMCHGSDLEGGPALEPDMPAGPNIAAYGDPGGWSEEQFVTTIRTGVTPYGRELDREFMPWDIYANMTDDELAAMWRYIASLNSE